jgi:hypothetical protein
MGLRHHTVIICHERTNERRSEKMNESSSFFAALDPKRTMADIDKASFDLESTESKSCGSPGSCFGSGSLFCTSPAVPRRCCGRSLLQ